MTPQEIRLVRSSYDRLEPRAVQVAENYLDHLLRAEPSMAPMFKAPRLAITLVGVVVTLPCDTPEETSVTPAGRTLVKETKVAAFGPALVMVKT